MWRRGGGPSDAGFDPAEISERLAEPDTLIWVDLCGPRHDELRGLAAELGLSVHAIEDAISPHERAKVDRYHDHLFLNLYGLELSAGALLVREVSAFMTERVLVTVRRHPGFPVEELLARWSDDQELARHGVAFLLHGLLDLVVDQHFEVIQRLDDEAEAIEDLLFDENFALREIQRRSFDLRKNLVLLRRVVLPMRELVDTLLHRDLGIVSVPLTPYYQDVHDHTLRAAEWADGLRDLVANLLETRVSMQGNHLNEVMKKVTSWAAIIAVPTAVTGYYGQNLPYPGHGQWSGFVTSTVVIVLLSVGLYFQFKRRDWL